MSLEYCEKCDLMIDLDNDEHFEHFSDKWKQMKGGKDDDKEM